ncbi:MAG TPA: COG1361 S-layer family protein [Candidatus Nanoarchaeia archaeon]|nr:COG1361 S-layer family protein [Candidatus Nanoarchaeia archaeon]
MKKILFALVFLVLALSVYAAGPEISASVLRYDPTPAEQGNTVDIWVQLSNAGTEADRVSIQFVPEYPFNLPEGQTDRIDIGILAASESKVEKFTVFVDPSAPNGERNITFQYKFSSDDNWAQFEAPISLQTQNAGIVIEDYQVTPTPVVPGQITDLMLRLRNSGKVAVKNIDVGIELEDSSFSTINSGTKKRVDSIPAGGSATVLFKLASDTNTEIKLYNVPVSLSFQDERNTQFNESAKISLVVNAPPELALTVDSTQFTDKMTPGTVSLKVVNKGVTNLKYVTVRLATTQDYDVLSSSNEAYVGNLDSDDFETVDFTVKPLVSNPRLAVQVEFKDPYNAAFSQSYDLPLRIITDDDLGKGTSYWPVIVIVILVIGVVVYWRMRRKKR